MEIYCSCFGCMKSKQIILLDLKGCIVSDFSSELIFKSIGLKYNIFFKKDVCWNQNRTKPLLIGDLFILHAFFLKLLEMKLVLY